MRNMTATSSERMSRSWVKLGNKNKIGRIPCRWHLFASCIPICLSRQFNCLSIFIMKIWIWTVLYWWYRLTWEKKIPKMFFNKLFSLPMVANFNNGHLVTSKTTSKVHHAQTKANLITSLITLSSFLSPFTFFPLFCLSFPLFSRPVCVRKQLADEIVKSTGLQTHLETVWL